MDLSLKSVSYYFVVGLIVSMDVMALTVARKETYSATWRELRGWATLNAVWHAGLFAFYIFLIHVIVFYSKGFLNSIDFDWIRKYWPTFLWPETIIWLLTKLKIHFFSLFAALAITLVWFTYSTKIVSTPQTENAQGLNWFLQGFFWFLRRVMRSDAFNKNLQAALVAVDMLALAALIKANDQTRSNEDKVLMILCVGAAVFLLAVASAAFARSKLADPRVGSGDAKVVPGQAEAKIWLLITLRLVEPLLIFYFLLEVLALLVTGVHVDSPALLFAAVLMVVAIVRMHGLARVCDAANDSG